MNDLEQRTAAIEFANTWAGKGYEKGESQPFWISLLRDVYGIKHPEQYISFEDQVHIDHTSFIDGYISETKVLIEQKGLNKDLNKPIKQSDGSLLTPYQQAKRYISELPLSKHPRWVVTCNFGEFNVYDMENPNSDPEIILLANLDKEYYRLSFLVENGNEHIKKEEQVSKDAGLIVGQLYDALLEKYIDKDSELTLRSLNVLCVRFVFCLYAEDAGIFGKHAMFQDYLKLFDAQHTRKAIIELFKVLNTPITERDPYLEPELAVFPYVNGGLFEDEDIVIPQFTDEIRGLLINDASADFDWSEISPTIFGAVFESTLSSKMRRSGGMHYTSIENIHKIIDPLFLDDIKKEFDDLKNMKTRRSDGSINPIPYANKTKYLDSFQEKLANLKFLDPACGSGNFLTETYLSLRKIENLVIQEKYEYQKDALKGQISIGALENYSPIKIDISQFYGIEVNDFAVTVAKTALWIAESQMMKETEEILAMKLDFLPLKTNASIVEKDALTMDWNDIIPADELNYIMGNPPFVGKKEQSPKQKKELIELYGKNISGAGNMDYVTAWYIKAADYMKETKIHAAFVSTNSITQGEQPGVLWEKLGQYGVNITFAYRTFEWGSEANEKAHVHCVIIGFTTESVTDKKTRIYQGRRYVNAEHLNPYLMDGPTEIIKNRKHPICDVPEMCYGSMPIDDNHLILDEDAMKEALKENPNNARFIREYVGGEELLKGKKRWCIWLDGIDPSLYMTSKFIMKRIEETRQYRLNESTRPQTIKAGETPHLFGEIRQPQNGALVIPKVSSEDRLYIPISYVKPGIIINGSALMIPNASLYHFGILSSNIHNEWMRVIAGRMKSDYQYSAGLVYNNFPWPNVSEKQKEDIAAAAKAVLETREKHSNVSLANLYKEKNYILFGDLKTAHDNLNRLVMQAYGFIRTDESGKKKYYDKTEVVSELMRLHQEYDK